MTGNFARFGRRWGAGRLTLRCPECGTDRLQVVDSREAPDAVRRRRECIEGHRFTTYERCEVFSCPRCSATETRVEDTDVGARGVARTRRCGRCGLIFGTIEGLVRPDIFVIKADGRHEPFSGGKLFGAVRAACSKRPVATEELLMLADGIETELRDTGQTEVRSALLAEMVLERLQPLDEVASVRYASSYVEPGGVEEMLTVIRQTLDRRELQSIRDTNLPLVADESEPSD